MPVWLVESGAIEKEDADFQKNSKKNRCVSEEKRDACK